MQIPPSLSSDKEIIEWVNSLGGQAPSSIIAAALELKRSLTAEFKSEKRNEILKFLADSRNKQRYIEERMDNILEWINKSKERLPSDVHLRAALFKRLYKEKASLSEQLEALSYLENYRSKSDGAQATTGNLLQWTEGNGMAAYTSRYNQACRLKVRKLSEPELGEAEAVIIQAIKEFSESQKKVRLEVVLLEVKQQLERLMQAKDTSAAAALEAQANLPNVTEADNALTASLTAAIEGARSQTGGYVYLKQWTLADGTRWLKVGITNNPNRRDAEQNVLPVPAVTLRLMETKSMDQAAAIEKALHQQLASQKVTGAGNRELFHLNDSQLAALMAAMSL
jgi:hypothetical protein